MAHSADPNQMPIFFVKIAKLSLASMDSWTDGEASLGRACFYKAEQKFSEDETQLSPTKDLSSFPVSIWYWASRQKSTSYSSPNNLHTYTWN